METCVAHPLVSITPWCTRTGLYTCTRVRERASFCLWSRGPAPPHTRCPASSLLGRHVPFYEQSAHQLRACQAGTRRGRSGAGHAHSTDSGGDGGKAHREAANSQIARTRLRARTALSHRAVAAPGRARRQGS
eukprot:6823460-Prymnesium_polylepis.1